MNRYSVTPGALQLDSNGGFVAYEDHLFEVTKLMGQVEQVQRLAKDSDRNHEKRYARMLERAQRAERQVINAARALGYIDDEG